MSKKSQRRSGILPVPRSKKEAEHYYDRISRFYDFLSGRFEHRYAARALELLDIQAGESVLEIGSGTGKILKEIARKVGDEGKTCGIDISSGMLKVTRKRLAQANLTDRVALLRGDATALPYADNSFDAVFMSFTLELFDTPEIPAVLVEIKRVLRTGGRVGIVSLSKKHGESMMLRLYEWIHRRWPKYLDCRPIYVEDSLVEAGFTVLAHEKATLTGLPLEIVISGVT